MKTFTELTTDELREMAIKTDPVRCNWDQWTREMLLAFFHNRRDKYGHDAASAAFVAR